MEGGGPNIQINKIMGEGSADEFQLWGGGEGGKEGLKMSSLSPHLFKMG